MSIGDRIVTLRNAKGLTRVQLADKLEIPMTTLRNYEFGTREPGHKFVLKVAQMFDVTTDYLLGMIDDPRPYKEIAAQSSTLSPAELNGIKKYRALDAHGKELVEMVLDKEAERLKKPGLKLHAKPELNAVVYDITALLISDQRAAAGRGVYLGPESFHTLIVKREAVPRKTSFCVPVAGDSMEPRYHDGDVLLLSKEPPELGEVGLFIMENYGYVKVRGDKELISLNPDYEPIPMEMDQIESNYKVIGVLDRSAILEEIEDDDPAI